jgi:dethiobiotin synthetase
MKAIFIAGTDTGAGKTIITGLLGKFFLKNRYNTITQKWVQTGIESDINTHLKIMEANKKDIIRYASLMCPYHFKFPCSPHLSSFMEKKTIKKDKIKKSFQTLKNIFDIIIIESTGGILVPLSKSLFIIDIAKELSLPVILVVNNKLGAINHTLLSIEALKKRKIQILGIIFNNVDKNCNNKILENNPLIIKKITGETILGILPHTENTDLLYKKFIPIGKNILSRIKK